MREKGTSLSRDDRVHGSMLIINELIMNCAWVDEVGSGWSFWVWLGIFSVSVRWTKRVE